jgi:hypothetical protein
MAKVVIAELDIDIQALLKTTSDLKKEIDKLKNTQKDLAASGQASSEAFVENEAVLKTLTGAYSQNIKAIQESGKATTQQTDQTELLNLALTQEATSISEAREQNKLLNKLRNETNVTTKEGQAQLTQLNAKLDANNAFIKQNGDAYLKQKINIGNYKEDIKSALGELNLLNGGLQQFGTAGKVAAIGFKIIGDQAKDVKNSFAGFTTGANSSAEGLKSVTNEAGKSEKATIGFTIAQKASAIATNASSAALGVFRLALISTGIGALIVALGSLIAFLSTTQAGIDAVTSVTRPLQAIFKTLLGVVQEVGQSLFNAFTNPKQALSDLADFVKQNLINRFTALGKILQGIVELDFKKVGDGVLQATTGVENLTGKISNAAKATGKILTDAANKGKEIDSLTKQIEQSEINLNKQRAIAEGKMVKLRLISKDTSLDTAQRVKAQNEIVKLAEDEANRELAINGLKVKRLKIEQSLNNTSREGKKELANLEADGIKIQAKGDQARLEGIRVTATLNKEAAAAQKEQRNKQLKEEEELKAKQKAAAEKEAADKLSLAKAELDLFLANEKSKLDGSQQLTADLIKEEEFRLKEINRRKLEQLQKEKSINLETLENKKANNQALTQAEIEYETQRILLAKETDATIQKNNQDLENQIKAQKAAQLEAQKEIDLANAQTQLEADLLYAQQKYDAELELLRKNLEDKKITEDQYNQKREIAESRRFEMERAAQTVHLHKQLNDFQVLGNGLQQLFGKNKALATAMSLINGAQAITSILAQYPKFDGGFAMTAALISAGATTVAQVAKINSTKFEQGGIQEIGGKRHSAGGTKFYGEDGTMFEAERGEGIGILNRGAYSAFMDFNNQFGSGKSGGGMFAGGGIITQGVKPQTPDMTMIAEALANMPAPVVAVEEIQTVGQRYVSVKANADF